MGGEPESTGEFHSVVPVGIPEAELAWKTIPGSDFAQAMLDSLTSSVAVLDDTGTIIATNERWRSFARENGATHAQFFVGENYLATCEAVPSSSGSGAASVASRLRDILTPAHGEYRFEYPCHSAGEQRWFELRATSFQYGNRSFAVTAHENVTDRKRLDEARQLLVRELNHRVNNLFTIALGLVTATAHRVETADQLARVVSGRLMALAKAHHLLLPAVEMNVDGGSLSSLTELVHTLTAAHVADRAHRIRIVGPNISIGAHASIDIALLVHELTTNAAKYGSLSSEHGSLSIEWHSLEDRLILTWTESGGPPVSGPPEHQGFGSELARRSIEGQLGGYIERDWLPGGLVVRVSMPLGNLQK